MDKTGDVENFRSRGQSEVLADLRRMVNDSTKSDVVFRCCDGKAVHACRLLLANRCPFFDRMFHSGMLETGLSTIPLPGLSSRVVLSVVEFLYTGTMDSYPICDWKMGFEMMAAAKFFMIPTIEFVVRDFLEVEAAHPPNWQQHASMRMLSEALEFEETWEGRENMLQRLVSNIHNDWFEDSYYCDLSRNAAEYILCHAAREPDQSENQPSMEEYCLLRNIVVWHAQAVMPDSRLNEIGKEILSSRECLWSRMLQTPDIDEFISDFLTTMSYDDSTDVLNATTGVVICKDSLEQMLQQYVNLSLIPASLLLTVIHPLRLFPPGQLLKALIKSALCRHVQRAVLRSDWRWYDMSNTCISFEPGGHVLCKSDQGKDLVVGQVAIARIPEPRSSDTYEWSFEVLDDTAVSKIDVGFVCVPRDDCNKLHDIVERRSLWPFPETRVDVGANY